MGVIFQLLVQLLAFPSRHGIEEDRLPTGYHFSLGTLGQFMEDLLTTFTLV